MTVKFRKYTGAGNDFVLLDSPVFALTPELIRNMCDRRFGIGADGVLVIRDEAGFNFGMEYYNADGSTGSLCGNGARCALGYVFSHRLPSEKTVNFLCNCKKYSGDILEDGLVKFYLNNPTGLRANIMVKTERQNIPAFFIDTGSPHVVINAKDVEEIFPGNTGYQRDFNGSRPAPDCYGDLNDVPVVALGRQIRYSEDFPQGTNVNFVQKKDNKLYIRTYERGVEDETLACGTGASASAVYAFLKFEMSPPVELVTRSGISLFVDFEPGLNNVDSLTLTGPAKEVFSGEINLNL